MEAPFPNTSSWKQDLSGSTFGNYQLVRKIAEGGMGIVYEAVQLKLDRKVALKILTDQLAAQPEFLRRFEREAKSAAALNHPNIVQVHDFGEANGRHYLIMEYVDGEDLSVYVEQHGKLPVEEALNVIEQAAQGLKSAYEKSIIHRDIKPANLMRARDGRVKVSDLGLAKVLTEVSDATLSGIGIGSPYYIAPEQADNARHVDHRVDIYSLGITLFFLVTGKRPYDGETPFSIILAHVNKPLPSGIDLGTALPKEVEGLIQRMAAKKPEDRYQDYDSLLADLQRVRSGFAPLLKVRRAPISRTLLLGSAIGALGIIAGLSFVFVAHNKSLEKKKSKRDGQAEPAQNAIQKNRRFGPGSGPDGANFRNPATLRDPQRPPFEPGRMAKPMDRDGIQLPMGPPPDRDFYSIPEGPVDMMLAKADEYSAQHKENFLAIIDVYEQVRDKAGAAERPRVESKLSSVIEAQQKISARTIQEYETKMQARLQAGKPGEAYRVWKDFPANLRTREVDEQIRTILRKAISEKLLSSPPQP